MRDAAQLFPANVNVAVALSAAGVGPDLTQYEIWADPEVERNTHVYRVESDEQFRGACFGSAIRHKPGDRRADAAVDAIATLRGMVSTVRVGT